MYSQDKIDIALKVYYQCGSVIVTIRVLVYPTKKALYTWIKNQDSLKPSRKALNNINTVEHPRNSPFKVKTDAIHRFFELGEGIKSVSEEIGYARTCIYNWQKRYLKGGTAALMNRKNIKSGTRAEGTAESAPELEHMQARMKEMPLKIDILKKTIDVLKKDPGIDQTALKNSEKAVIVDALKTKYSLPILLIQLNFPKSSYYHQVSVQKKREKI